MNTLAVLAITMYVPHTNLLYCGEFVSDQTEPWFALPVSEHGITWECGDRICVDADGARHCGWAKDAGPFGRFCVLQLDGTCPRIAVDVPEAWAWFEGLSTTGQVWNVSAVRREWEQYR